MNSSPLTYGRGSDPRSPAKLRPCSTPFFAQHRLGRTSPSSTSAQSLPPDRLEASLPWPVRVHLRHPGDSCRAEKTAATSATSSRPATSPDCGAPRPSGLRSAEKYARASRPKRYDKAVGVGDEPRSGQPCAGHVRRLTTRVPWAGYAPLHSRRSSIAPSTARRHHGAWLCGDWRSAAGDRRLGVRHTPGRRVSCSFAFTAPSFRHGQPTVTKMCPTYIVRRRRRWRPRAALPSAVVAVTDKTVPASLDGVRRRHRSPQASRRSVGRNTSYKLSGRSLGGSG